jgi:hypothetical protein
MNEALTVPLTQTFTRHPSEDREGFTGRLGDDHRKSHLIRRLQFSDLFFALLATSLRGNS